MTRWSGVALLILGGCAYYNALYNANRAFEEAEAARRDGREALARTKYGEAIEKAAKSYRSSEDGRWADDALYLIGRSHARRGDWAEAQAALETALERTTSPSLAAGARVYLGAAAVSLGDDGRGMALLDAALADLHDDRVRAEAFLWRARARYGAGADDRVWSDLDSASVGGERYRVEAALDRLAWGVETGILEQALQGAEALLQSGRAAAASDTVEALIRASSTRWGPEATRPLLERVEAAAWPPQRRDALLLLRAQISYEAGALDRAREDAELVSRGVGAQADAARVLLARWRLRELADPGALDDVRAVLLPAVGSTEALGILEDIKEVGLLVERSRRPGQELALFAAAEVARDGLGAPGLAHTLFLAYADLARGSAWEGKALLAALQTARDPKVRGPIETRLAEIPDNTYVLASRWSLGERQNQYTAVERRLEGILSTIRAQVAAEAARRDVVVSQAAQALDSIRASEAIARRLAAGDSTVLDSLRADSVRLDSIRRDSIRGDSLRGLDSLFTDTLFRDTLGAGGGGRPERPRPVLRPLRDPRPDSDSPATSMDPLGYDRGP